jgi:repressor LexA
MALTRRQREIYDFVREFIHARGYSPSLEEIGEKFGLASVATVHKHVQHLVEKGWLRKSWNRSRSVEPVERESFVLRVRGDSMIDEQIRDGDHVVVERRHEARNGETVVARVRGTETTLKKFFRRGGKVVLEPANQALRPIELPAADVEIEGIVRGLLRTY